MLVFCKIKGQTKTRSPLFNFYIYSATATLSFAFCRSIVSKIFFLSRFAELMQRFITTIAKSIKNANTINATLYPPKRSKHIFAKGAPSASPAVFTAENTPTTLMKLLSPNISLAKSGSITVSNGKAIVPAMPLTYAIILPITLLSRIAKAPKDKNAQTKRPFY